MRIFALSDPHGSYLGVRQALDRAGFQSEADRLICIGDVCDGWGDTSRLLDFLAGLPDFIYVKGNHDWWLREWAEGSVACWGWITSGGLATLQSYGHNVQSVYEAEVIQERNVPEAHLELLRRMVPYHVELGLAAGPTLFVHAGFVPGRPLEMQDEDDLTWERSFWDDAVRFAEAGEPYRLGGWSRVVIGHTPDETSQARIAGNVINIDANAGGGGRVCVYEPDTNRFWYSDPSPELYPDFQRHTS